MKLCRDPGEAVGILPGKECPPPSEAPLLPLMGIQVTPRDWQRAQPRVLPLKPH